MVSDLWSKVLNYYSISDYLLESLRITPKQNNNLKISAITTTVELKYLMSP